MRARRPHDVSLAAGALGVAMLVLACSGAPPRTEEPPPPVTEVEAPPPPPPPDPVGPAIPEDEAAPEGGAPCTRSSECGASELACRGAPGCASPWACGAPRQSCGPDTVSYCDCDGITFHALAGCPGRSYAHVGPCDDPGIADASYGIPDGDEPITTRDRTCTSSADCRGGEICYGPPGCGMEWRCERVRGCWRGGRTEFCGCDGATFTAPRHCPGQLYARRGSCDEEVAVAETHAPPTSSVPPPPTVTRAPPTSSTSSISSTSSTSSTTASTATSAGATTPTAPLPPLAPGQCRSSRDCGRGEVCAGGAGCGDPWTCIHRTERCNPDTQYFCDCEGHSFTASMTCPSRPYAHRGSCAIDQAMDLAGAALR